MVALKRQNIFQVWVFSAMVNKGVRIKIRDVLAFGWWRDFIYDCIQQPSPKYHKNQVSTIEIDQNPKVL